MVDGELYAPGYNGQSSRWYKASVTQKGAPSESLVCSAKSRSSRWAAMLIIKFGEAYRAKYRTNPYLTSMIADVPELLR